MLQKTTTKKKIMPEKVSACYFTQTGTKPDFKEVLVLRRFISDRGKILPQKITGLTAKNQRLLANEIKKARYMGLLPYTDRHAIWYHIYMPALAVYIGSQSTQILLENEDSSISIDTVPFVYSKELFGALCDESSFYKALINSYLKSVHKKINNYDVLVCSYFDTPKLSFPTKI